MSDQFVRVAPDSTGKKIQTYENTVNAQPVHAQAVVLVDSAGVPITPLTSTASLLLHSSGDSNDQQTSGSLIVGQTYLIITYPVAYVGTSGLLVVGHAYVIGTYVDGDDFTNVGADSNETGVRFVATGTTPADWSNGSAIYTGDEFTSVGASSNRAGVTFVATGTTPTTWTNGSTLSHHPYSAQNSGLIVTDANNVEIGRIWFNDPTMAERNSRSIFIGANAGANSSTADSVAIGFNALSGGDIAFGNTAIGSGAMASNNGSPADLNTAIGFQALSGQTIGYENTAIGYNAGSELVDGFGNVVIGQDAGLDASSNRSTVIGSGASTVGNNTIVIGKNAHAYVDNWVRIGNSSNDDYAFGGTNFFINATGAGGDGSQLTGLLAVNVVGTITNDDAATGNIGEEVESLKDNTHTVSLTNNTAADVTGIDLTAGDWDVEGNVNFKETTSTVTARTAGISVTSATLPTDGSEAYCGVQSTLTSEVNSITLPRKRISLATATTVYLVGKANFSAGTCAGFGTITARRVR